ncbi:uncharacterized protein CcaverHIS019_0200760 [Cutaneotrichosporon cavernicola]|uniref:Uncharacterized protein n=1 Tax=Cutaneotrichosporon cavernicola TaxID=279322 RepID=A0AA48KXV9_9TREE|nr:uncharacterized protein CcaverHIS019_0200760 [Cutaneotrichosporon cavernicola]BEI88714.1 hypothetical protein CcaverHIS019_0200760 [Cutaneotrichosporon cavernicola]BEI96488.1 hypothetical protein CcaverHIS631_0200770 [Cutaneotrichosporon cavernicola]BEJ04259.1 hypothetical protein CcaverHIS641_0200760 [Cutaneotrichosporon cavernicola]
MPNADRVLDSTIYPHFADSVLGVLIARFASSPSHASRRKVLALRRINRATRDLVDIHLIYRFVVKGRPRHPTFIDVSLGDALSLPIEPVPIQALDADRPRKKRARVEPSTRVLRRRAGGDAAPPPQTSAPAGTEIERRARSLLQHTRLLDIGNDLRCPQLWDAFAQPERFATIFPKFQALRITGERFPTLPPGTLLPPTVWFRCLDPVAEGHPVHYRLDPVPTLRLVWSVTFHPTTMAGAAWVEPFYASDETKEFVYLFVPSKGYSLRLRESGRFVRPRSPGFAWGDYRVPSGALGVLEDVVFHMGPELERSHTLVGLEGMQPNWLGLDDDAGMEEVFTAIRAGIKTALLARRDDSRDRVVHAGLWPDSLIDACVERVRIMTLDEYRVEVGEKQFEWETNLDVDVG